MLDNFKKKFNQFYNTLVHPFKSLWIFSLYRFRVYFREDWKIQKKKRRRNIFKEGTTRGWSNRRIIKKKKKKVKACVIASTR